MVWPGSGRRGGRWAAHVQLMCTQELEPRMPLTQPGFPGAWKEKQQLGARRDLGAESQSHRKGTCRARRRMHFREEPELEICPMMQEHIAHRRGRWQEGSLVCNSRVGKRQGHGSVQMTQAIRKAGCPHGTECAVFEAITVRVAHCRHWVPFGAVAKWGSPCLAECPQVCVQVVFLETE